MFTTKAFKKGDLVYQSRAVAALNVRTPYTIQVDWNKHVLLDDIANFMNHSCDPSVILKDNDQGAYDLIAFHDLDNGDEVTFDYETTESDSISLSKCLCGATLCRGALNGYTALDQATKQKYGLNIATYLQKTM